MAKSGEATLLIRIKQAGQEVLDRLVITAGDITSAISATAGAVIDFAKQSVAAYSEAEQGVNKLNQAMINQGTFSAELQNKYLDLASSLSQVTTFTDDAIISAQSILQSHIGNREVTESLVKATLNLAAAKSIDLSSAAELVGKSIAGENNLLQRQGIHLDESAAKHDKLSAVITAIDGKFKGIAESQTKGLGAVTQLSKAYDEFKEALGERLAPAVASTSSWITKLVNSMTNAIGGKALYQKSIGELTTEAQKLRIKLIELDNQMESLQKRTLGNARIFSPGEVNAIEGVKKATEESLVAIKARMDELRQSEAQSNANAEEQKKINTIQKSQETLDATYEQKSLALKNENALIGLQGEELIGTLISQNDVKLQSETNYKERKRLMDENYNLLEAQGKIKTNSIITKNQEEENRKREADQRATFSTIATLSKSSNSTLAAIGKAAGITQIAIDTPVAVGRALAAFPPPFNFIAAGLVAAAMAQQAAQIAGVQLAEGGLVMPRPGGVQATIAEAGQPEVVIPLDRMGEFGLGGGGVTIIVNGGLLGDEKSAHDLAIAVDRQLLKLRQNGESVAFDERVV